MRGQRDLVFDKLDKGVECLADWKRKWKIVLLAKDHTFHLTCFSCGLCSNSQKLLVCEGWLHERIDQYLKVKNEFDDLNVIHD